MPKVKNVAQKHAAIVERTDRQIARVAGAKRNTPVIKTLGTISDVSDQPPLIAISTLTIGAGLISRDARLTRSGVRMLASHWLATKMKSFVKHRIDRTRPFVMLGGGAYHAVKGSSPEKRENSFPSGHTAGAVAVARAVARDYPETAPVGYAAASSAAAMQLPRGMHFLSDVLAGALIGLAAEAVVALVLPVKAPEGAGGDGAKP